MKEELVVKSHVARDLLQSAGLFKNDRLVVWEYVSNSLQYVEHGMNATVRVKLESRKKRIEISDNGRGMDWNGLQNFFVMHGENQDRIKGRPGRGRFGTGKSAAFGIADTLRVTSVHSGNRSSVELNRNEITQAKSGDPIPIRTVEREAAVDQPNGTIVEIDGIHLRSLDQAGIIRYIERHLVKWPKTCRVYVNNHECEFAEPPTSQTHVFEVEGEFRKAMGETSLCLRVSKTPLDDDMRGVSVFSNGVWHETTLAGSEGRDMSNYLFGEIDVPQLDLDTSPIAPFDISRSMRLNPENPLVRTIHAFIGSKIELIRKRLVSEERNRRAEEESRKLAEQADEIAKVINEDFDNFRQRISRVRARGGTGSDAFRTGRSGDGIDEEIVLGDESAAEAVPTPPNPDPVEKEPKNLPSPEIDPPLEPKDTEADAQSRLVGGSNGRRKPKGGFRVEFKAMGTDSNRAEYASSERTIYINLDHPQLKAALGEGAVEDVMFKRLSYEVAFAEYSIALAQEMAAHDEFIDPTDPIVEIRDTLNRVARKGALLYSR